MNITPKKRHLCAGSLRHEAELFERRLSANGTPDFSLEHIPGKKVRAALETKAGVEVFDGTNLAGVATHFFYIRFIAGLTREHRIKFRGEWYRILSVENLDEDGRFLRLSCAKRGPENMQANRR